MQVVDANVLLYAVNADSDHHDQARAWLDHALAGGATVGFDWTVLLAFVRLSTMRRVFAEPLTAEEAMAQVRQWLDQPGAVTIQPPPHHPEILASLLTTAKTAGNLVNDAHLAALAIAHRGTVVTFDSDFDRFEGVRWLRPTAPTE